MSQQKISRYHIIESIGRGGMATVYRAFDPMFKRDVAVKVMAGEHLTDETLRARFEREAQTIAALEHPAIVPVYDFGEENNQLFLVMRIMTGGTLTDRLKHGSLSITDTNHILQRIGGALERAHAKGIIHRDLKPSNILFDSYGDAFLADFGIARLTESTVTLTGQAVVGTPAYMSPEQIHGDKEIDGRSDIYALGVICFEMLTGQRPYQDTTPAKVMMKHIIDPVPDIRKVNPSLPVGVDVVIAKTMAKTPEERYATASELTDTLDAIARPAVPPMSYPTAAPLEEPEVEIPPSPTVIDESNDATVLAEEVGLVAGEVVPVEQPLTEPGSQVQTSMAAMEEADETEVARPIFSTKSPAASAPKEEKKRSLLVPVLIGGGLLIGLFVIVGVVLLISNLSGEEPAEPTPYSPASAGSEPATEPAQEVAAEQEESTPTPLPEVDTLEQANALMEQAWALYDAGNFDRALELVQQAIDLDPDYAYHYRERAMMFLWQGDPAPALADINRAIEREDNADYFYERGLIFRELGDSERAVSSYHQAIEMNHENADYFADLGIDLRYIGALDESLDALNHAVEMNPSNGYYHAQRSYTLREIGHPEGALEDALLAYEINPDDVDMLDQIAHIYAWELEDPESALPYFDMAIERDPNNSGRYTDRALIHRWLGNADEAMADHNRAIELDPESAWNYLERGISFKDLFEAYEEAIADFDTAEELDPSDPGPYDARAGIFEDSFGDYDRAIGEVSRAIEEVMLR
ncbi:MAG: protein kinase domain-containing protein, partial [Candidatus Promineifilaceae bacterium]